MRTTKHFNDVCWQDRHILIVRQHTAEKGLFFLFLNQISNLIATEILRCEDVVTRVAVIEKWVAVADICRCLHNYNAVLEITSSLNRSSVFRLKKTWLKVSKQVWITRNPLSLLDVLLLNCVLDNRFLSDESTDWQAAEAGLIGGEVQKPEGGFEEVRTQFCSQSVKETCRTNTWCVISPPAVTLPVCPIWECTSLTWLSLRRERQITQRTTWSTSPRWEWWGVGGEQESKLVF